MDSKKELMTISDIARHVGLSRPRCSKLASDNGLKIVNNGKVYVDKNAFQELLMRLAADGKMKGPSKAKQEREIKNSDALVEHLKDEMRRLTEERNTLAEKCRALEAVQGEVRLLKASVAEKDNRIESLITKIEILESTIDRDERMKKEKYEKVKGSIVGRLLGL